MQLEMGRGGAGACMASQSAGAKIYKTLSEMFFRATGPVSVVSVCSHFEGYYVTVSSLNLCIICLCSVTQL